MKSLLLLFALGSTAWGACPATWSNSYTYCRQVTLNHTLVSTSNQSNYPAPWFGTFTYLKTVGNGGHVQNSSGFDIIFTSDNLGTTKLAWETDVYTATTGAVAYHIKIPTLATGADTVIYLFYGNASISTDQSNKTGTWDANFQAIYHLPNGTVLTSNDSTSNANTASGVNTPTAATGQIDGGVNLVTASSQYLAAGNPASLQITGPFTYECWFKMTSTPPSSNLWRLISKDGVIRGITMYIFNDGSNSNLWGDAFYTSAPTTDNFTQDTTSLTTATWYYGAFTFDGSIQSTYLNGAIHGTGPIFPTGPFVNNTAGTFQIGTNLTDGGGTNFDGVMDEVRVSNSSRSVDWLLTTYNAISNNATFVTIGSEITTARPPNQFPRVA